MRPCVNEVLIARPCHKLATILISMGSAVKNSFAECRHRGPAVAFREGHAAVLVASPESCRAYCSSRNYSDCLRRTKRCQPPTVHRRQVHVVVGTSTDWSMHALRKLVDTSMEPGRCRAYRVGTLGLGSASRRRALVYGGQRDSAARGTHQSEVHELCYSTGSWWVDGWSTSLPWLAGVY